MSLVSLRTSVQINHGSDISKVLPIKKTQVNLPKTASNASLTLYPLASAAFLSETSKNPSFLNLRNAFPNSCFKGESTSLFKRSYKITVDKMKCLISKVKTLLKTPSNSLTQLPIYQQKAKKLAEEIKNIFALDQTYMLGYYRNSEPAFKNLIIALEAYAANGNLSQKIATISPEGMGSVLQSDTVNGTFLAALDPSEYGGIQQTIAVIKEDLKNNKMEKNPEKLLLKSGEEVLRLLSKIYKI